MNRKERETALIIIADGIRQGMTRKLACDLAGITDQTLRNWIKDVPAIDNMLNKAKADWVMKILPKVEDKEPWKLLKSVARGEYVDDPSTAIQINVDARPLINIPTTDLLAALKQLKDKAKELPPSEPAKLPE